MGMEELEKDTSVDIFDRSTNNVRKPEVIGKYRIKLYRKKWRNTCNYIYFSTPRRTSLFFINEVLEHDKVNRHAPEGKRLYGMWKGVKK